MNSTSGRYLTEGFCIKKKRELADYIFSGRGVF